MLFNFAESFDLLADRVCEKIIYKNIAPKAFELRGDNSEPFYLHIDVKETEESYTTGWKANTPSFDWREIVGSSPTMTEGDATMTGSERTYNYNGHCITADHKTLPLVYRFEIKGEFKTFLVYYLFWLSLLWWKRSLKTGV